MRRLVKAALSADLIRAAVTQGQALRCVRGIPRDAELVGIVHDPSNLRVHALYRHASFPETADDGLIPELEPGFLALAPARTNEETHPWTK